MQRYPGSQEPKNTTKSHRTTNFTQRFIGRGETRRVAASARARNSRELTRIQGLLELLREGGGSCHGGPFHGGERWDFMFRDWAFYSVG